MAAAMLALERGEIDGYPTAPVDALKRSYSKQISEGKLRLLLQFGPSPSPGLPNVPYALDYAKTSEQRSLLDIAQGPLGVGYGYMIGPDVPKDRAKALQDAFSATLRDPVFLADAKRETLSVLPVSGADIHARLVKAYGTPARVIAPIRAVYGK
jgi:tripartite-type tricarboxylate transporter receptor subunit TctC